MKYGFQIYTGRAYPGSQRRRIPSLLLILRLPTYIEPLTIKSKYSGENRHYQERRSSQHNAARRNTQNAHDGVSVVGSAHLHHVRHAVDEAGIPKMDRAWASWRIHVVTRINTAAKANIVAPANDMMNHCTRAVNSSFVRLYSGVFR